MSAGWTTFCAINGRRRAVRDFDGSPIADEDVRAILEQALLAPSSGNLQPYRIHWIRDASTRLRVAAACRGQRAAVSASTLLVFTASVETARATAEHASLAKFRRFSRWGTIPLWSPLHALAAAVWPAILMWPIGSVAARHWAARSAIFAAQTVLLAAAARGLDSCPMEGFSAHAVARILGIPRTTVIPVVIALGRRRLDARVGPRWRRPFSGVVIEW